MDVSYETRIRDFVRERLEAYAADFERRHLAQLENPSGTINAKSRNVFIASLGPEVQFYSALVRSLDSSMGNLVEEIAQEVAAEHFTVSRDVEGVLNGGQTALVAELLESYKARRRSPQVHDYVVAKACEALGAEDEGDAG